MKIQKKIRLGFAIFILQLFIGNCSGHFFSGESLDLAGEWSIELKECFSTELHCKEKLNHLRTKNGSIPMRIQVPENLHKTYPWFHGKSIYKKSFELDEKKYDLLMLGSIGSVDRVLINGIEIGGLGYQDENSSLSEFNTIRQYRIPVNTLKVGRNEILVHVENFDIKSGIHAGPVLLGKYSDLIAEISIYQLVREYIFIAIPVILMLVFFVFLVTVPFWRPGEGNIWILISFFGYFIHSFYYIPFPWLDDHLSFLKLQWIGRIASKVFSFLYFYKSFGLKNSKSNSIAIGLFLALSLHTLFQASYHDYFRMELIQHGLFCIGLFVPLYWKKSITDKNRQNNWKHYIMLFPIVLIVYINDLLMRMYWINTPWMYHYLSFFNTISFLSIFIYHIYLWKEQSHIEWQNEILRHKQEIAHEIHDMIGSELSQIVVLTEKNDDSKATSTSIATIAKSCLEKVRDFSRILKGDDRVKTLPELISFYEKRFRSIRSFSVEKYVDEAANNLKINNFVLLQLERIVSEWISNILKHSSSNHIKLGLKKRAKRNYITLFIIDSPNEFSWSGKSENGGLLSILFRSKAISAKIRSLNLKNQSIFILQIPIQ